MSNYIIYTRASTTKQDYTFEAQENSIKNFLKSSLANFNILRTVKERSSGKNNERELLKEAIKECKEENATLIVAKLDRLSRDISFIFNLHKELINNSINLVIVDMPQINTLTLGIYATLAQHEREIISTRTKEGMKIAKSQGKKIGFQGHKDKDSSLANLRKARESRIKKTHPQSDYIQYLYKGGLSLRAIANRLNENNIRTQRGKIFYASTIANILKVA